MAITKAPKKGDTLFMVREKGYGSSRDNKTGPAKVISSGPKYFRVVFDGPYPGNPVEFFTENCGEHYMFGGREYELFENEAAWTDDQKRRKLVSEVFNLMKSFDLHKATVSQLTTLKAALS